VPSRNALTAAMAQDSCAAIPLDNVGRSSAGLHVFVDNHCQAHPLDAVIQAGGNFPEAVLGDI
jgi:hypothetical protein